MNAGKHNWNYEVKKCKDDVEENISKLRESSEELAKIQKVYNEKKKLNNKLEKEIEDLVDELASLNTVIHAKQGTAEELEKVVKEIESEIKKTMIAREKSTKEELEIIEKKKERQKLERQKRNKDLEDLEKNQKQLLKEFQNQEDDLRKKKTILKEYKYAARKTRNYNFNDLRHEYEMLVGEIDKIKIDQQAEAKLKMEYFNMLQDMLGKMKIICRISLPSDDSVIQVVNENIITITTLKDKTFYFDHIYVPKSQNQDVLEAVDYLYEKANIGFNCYIVTMGGTKSGKTHLMLGPKKDGIIWLGLDKIKDVLIKNRKDHLQTRFFVCSVEMTDNQIFDLLSGEIKNKAEIKQDAFKMTLFSNVNYKECFAEDEIRKLLKTAVGNRQKASTSLKSKSTSFIFLVTFQVFNKHQRRYWKGKITHIKLACLNSMKSLNEELYNFIKGKDINYKRNLITQLLQDGFGGNAKTCIIGTINPSKKNLKETAATLKLVSGFRKCSNEIEIHSETEKVYSLKNDIERLLRGVKIENICP